MKSCSPCVVLSILPIAFLLTLCSCSSTSKIFLHLLNHFRKDNINFSGEAQSLKQEYGDFEGSLKTELKEKVREIFFRGYTNYYEHAYPLDELNPVDCLGRGPDYANPSNININDVLGNFSLTLIDSLDAIAIIGSKEEFHAAVKDVIDVVNFDQDSVVQVFEANIRVLGSLLSAHLLLTVDVGIGNLTLSGYEFELLDLAHDLGVRLIQAFENSPTGLPFPRVNLRHGVPENWSTENCLAAAGSLLIEFGLLSRLVGDPDFEWKARRANAALWEMRSNTTGLLGNTFDVLTGQWNSKLSGLGAGMDSFYEYLLKSFILFGEPSDLAMFEESYRTIKKYMRKGRSSCFDSGEPPLYVNVNLDTGTTQTTWVDALQASFPAVQVLYGDVAEAVCLHAFYHGVWKKYGLMPERYNWQLNAPDVFFYPLRPEFVESTYFLYQATKHPYYLHVGKEILWSLENHTKCKCGYCTVHDVRDKSHEDRMESFFLSETCKYLYLLFDEEHPVNRYSDRFLFTTEGHIVPVLDYPKPWLPLEPSSPSNFSSAFVPSSKCSYPTEMNHRSLPMEAEHFVQLFKALNVDI